MKTVHDINGKKIQGLFRNGDALVVNNPNAFQQAQLEKDRIQKSTEMEQTLETVVNDIAIIKQLLQTLIREQNG